MPTRRFSYAGTPTMLVLLVAVLVVVQPVVAFQSHIDSPATATSDGSEPLARSPSAGPTPESLTTQSTPLQREFIDGFEDDQFQDTWTIDNNQSDADAQVVSTRSRFGNNSLKIRVGTSGSGDYAVVHNLSKDISKNASFSFWWYSGSRDTNLHVGFRNWSGSASISLNVGGKYRNIGYRSDQLSSRKDLATQYTGEWYKATIVVHPKTDTADLIIENASGGRVTATSIPTTVDFDHVRISATDYFGNYDVFIDDTALNRTNRPPQAAFTVAPETPQIGEQVALNASNATDPDGSITSYAWDLDSDGDVEDRGPVVTTNFSSAGNHTVILSVTDNAGLTSNISENVSVLGTPDSASDLWDGFEDDGFQDTWTIDNNQSDAFGEVVSTRSRFGSKSFKIHVGTSGSGDYAVVHNLTQELSANATFSFWWYSTSRDTNLHVGFRNWSSSASISLNVGGKYRNLGYRSDQLSSRQDLASQYTGEWYKATIVAHPQSDTADIIVENMSGGQVTATSIPTTVNFDHIRISATDYFGNYDVYLDNTNFSRSNQRPRAVYTITPETPRVGEQVVLNGSDATDPDGSIVTYQWDLDNDGSFEKRGESVTTNFSSPGNYTIVLSVTDNAGAQNISEQNVTVKALPQTSDGFSEGFEDGNLSAWNGSTGALQTSNDSIEGAESGKLLFADHSEVWIDFTPTEMMTYSFWWKAGATNDNEMTIWWANATGSIGFGIEVGAENMDVVYARLGQTRLDEDAILYDNPLANTWYQIRFHNVSFKTHTYDVAIYNSSGAKLGELDNMSFHTPISSVSRLKIRNHMNFFEEPAYVDGISVGPDLRNDSEAPDTYQNWTNRRTISLTEQSGRELNHYPIVVGPFDIGDASAASLRVVNEATGAPIPFGVNRTASGYEVAFKVNLSAGETRADIAIYYGNPDAGSVAIPWEQARYNFHDGFDDGTIHSEWRIIKGNWSESAGTLKSRSTVNGRITRPFVEPLNQTGLPIRWEIRLVSRTTGAGTDQRQVYLRNGTRDGHRILFLRTFENSDDGVGVNIGFDSPDSQKLLTADEFSVNDWIRQEARLLPNGSIQANATNEETGVSGSKTYSYSTTYRYQNVTINDYGGSPGAEYDYVKLRYDVEPEPSVAIGAEETLLLPKFLKETFVEQRGDIAEIEVTVPDNTTPKIRIGSQAAAFNVTATVVDGNGDGKVTLYLDTFATAGGSPSVFLGTANGSDSLRNMSMATPPLSSPIDAYGYDLSLMDNGTEVDTATLLIKERSTETVRTFVAPNAASIVDSISRATPHKMVAHGDLLLAKIEASGLYAYFGGELDGTNNGLLLRFEEQNPGVNRNPRVFTGGVTTVIRDPENDTFWAILDTEDLFLQSGDVYAVEFRIAAEDNPLLAGTSPSDDEVVSTTFTVVKRTATFDDVPFVIRPAADQRIGGSTTLAPGTSLTLLLNNSATGAVLENRTTTVQPDGTWSVTLNGSSLTDGTEVTAKLVEVGVSANGTVSNDSTVTLVSQTADGPVVSVDAAYLHAGGFVALHEGSASGPIIGVSKYLSAGMHHDIQVSLESTPEAPLTVTAVAHRDTNGNATFDFPGADAPYFDDAGQPVAATRTVYPESAVRLGHGAVTPGGTAGVPITVSSLPTGLAGYNITVTVDNGSVASVVGATYPNMVNLTETTLGPEGQTIRLKAVDLLNRTGPGDANVTLVTVRVRGDTLGETNLSVSVNQMDDEAGQAVHTSTRSGSIRVSGCAPLASGLPRPTDPDSDGHFEDINGNGRLDFADVVELFEHFSGADAACHDFNGNGRMDFDDIVKLFQEI